MMIRIGRLRFLSCAIAVLFLLQTLLPSLATAAEAAQSNQDALRSAVRGVGTASYSLNVKAYLERATTTLKPLATDKKGKGIYTPDLKALQADLDSAFWDVSRVHSEDALRRMLALTRDLHSAWEAQGVTDPAALAGLSDMLFALRQTAEAALIDTRSFMGLQGGAVSTQPPAGIDVDRWQVAQNRLRQAEDAYRTGLAQLDLGNAQAAGEHFLLTWRKAYDAMGELGYKLVPGQVTDLDGDGAADQLEVRFGSSPLIRDTDGDGLGDAYEIMKAAGILWPFKADSDGDGIADGQEDNDQDSLNNLREQQLGTSPVRKDTDSDRLTDAEEVTFGSDPLKADSDADELADVGEKRAGTNPQNPDTDGDSIIDGRDLITGRVESPAAVISITGVGDLAGSVTIRSYATEARYTGLPGQASAVVDIKADGTFISARVELPLDMSQVPGGDLANVKMMYYDAAANQWRLVEGQQGFDPATGRAWAETTHFTMFALFYIPNWDDYWGIVLCEEGGGEGPQYVDVALVLDSSGSMSWNDPDDLRKVGAKRLVQGLLAEDRAAVVDFDNYAYLRQALTSNKAALEAAIDQIDSYGGTHISRGVSLGLSQLSTSPEGRARFMVLLTDGVGTYSHYYTDLAINQQVTIYVIGLGWDIDIPLLEQIAVRTGGKFYHVQNAVDLPEVFERVGEEVGDRDTDKDGLTDCEEVKGMRDRSGKLWYSDPDKVDTDGDGLSDEEEMAPLTELPPEPQSMLAQPVTLDPAAYPEIDHGDGFDTDVQQFRDHLKAQGTQQSQAAPAPAAVRAARPASASGANYPPQRTFVALSDPLNADSDGDGLDDTAEMENGTPATRADAEGDGVNDYDELLNGTDPFHSDTDRDSHPDVYEIAHETDGLDPVVADEDLTVEEWLEHFAAGAAAGDACDTILTWWTPCRDTVPFFLGQLAGGAASFIPVIGWIVGTIADIRDTLGSLIKGDWVGAGLGLVGLIPAGGDIVKIAGKIFDFVTKFGKLGKILKAVLMSLADVATLNSQRLATEGSTSWLFGEKLAFAGAGPPIAASSIGSQARELVMEVLRKVNPDGWEELRHVGGDDFLVRVGEIGVEFRRVAEVFNKLESQGLFTAYPRMQDFMAQMIKDSDRVFTNKAAKLSLNNRVTINLKKATGVHNPSQTYIDAYFDTMKLHLRGALAEYASTVRLPGTDEIIGLSHVNANGPDRVFRNGSFIDVLESKAYTNLSPGDLWPWLTKLKGTDEWVFDGSRLNGYLLKSGSSLSELIGTGAQLRYNLFTYADGALSGTVADLFASGAKRIKISGGGADDLEVLLVWTRMSPSAPIP